MWEGEGDRKDFNFQLYFLSHREDSPTWSLSRPGEGEEVERSSVINVCKAPLSSIPQLSLGCLHGSPLGSGVLGAPSCRGPWWGQAALLQRAPWGNGARLPPVQASAQNHCTGLFAGTTHRIVSRMAPVVWQGGQVPAGAWPLRARELCPEQSAPHLSQTSCAVAFSATSRPEQSPVACFCERFRGLALLGAFMQLPPKQRARTAL